MNGTVPLAARRAGGCAGLRGGTKAGLLSLDVTHTRGTRIRDVSIETAETGMRGDKQANASNTFCISVSSLTEKQVCT